MIENVIEALKQKLNKEQIFLKESMSIHTTFRIGGCVKAYITPYNTEEFSEAVKICKNSNVPYLVLGRGSNILFPDRDLDIVVISTLKMDSIALNDNDIVVAGAGVLLKDLSDFAWKNSLSGLEFACGIPGTVGGAIVMNAGAYDYDINGVFKSAKVLTDDTIQTIGNEDMQFGYRKSLLKEGRKYALEAEFELKKDSPNEIKSKMDEYMSRRNISQPVDMPSAGSVFKRPPGMFAGKLISDCGLKGFIMGGAQVSQKHAGFIVNRGGATASDVKNLIEHIQNKVYNNFGVVLETEIIIIE